MQVYLGLDIDFWYLLGRVTVTARGVQYPQPSIPTRCFANAGGAGKANNRCRLTCLPDRTLCDLSIVMLAR